MERNRPKSKKIYEDLCKVIPGGVNSPVRACQEIGQLPMVISHATKDIVVDVDGHSYIDYCCSWGALIHGHAHPTILDAVQKRMSMGTTFGITSSIEEQLASKVVELIPSIEKIRFVSSGTEATMSVARLARGYTNREIIVKFIGNYHGHADFFLVQAGSGVTGLSPTSSSAGIPQEIVKHTLCLPYNDVETCRNVLNKSEYKDRIAAVILEPIAGNMGVIPAKPEFIQMLREETQKIGALLIFDEVITGFRVGLRGAQEFYGIQPDLTCLGKIIGGGFPAAAFGGRQEIMDHLAPLGKVYQAGTLSGNPIAMEAGLQSINLLLKNGFYQDLERMSGIIIDPVKETIKKKRLKACVQHVGSMFTIFFGKEKVESMEDAKSLDLETYKKFFKFLFAKGVYIPPSQYEAWFISSAHETKNLETTRDLILDFLSR